MEKMHFMKLRSIIMLLTSVFMASFAGLTLGLALSGAIEVALVVTAPDLVETFNEKYTLNFFAGAGGIFGAVFRLIFRVEA